MAASEADEPGLEILPDGEEYVRPADMRVVQEIPAVVVSKVHVTYLMYQEARLDVQSVIRRGFRPRARRGVHAVRGVSFAVNKGEAVGIIGSNGSGKSTLLRAIAGLLPVNRGTIYARSRPTLLGVAAVLQPALSGRRNIYLGGLALGLGRQEINERFDDIVAFSGLAQFIDYPLNTYSSGMRARLHFSIATAVAPEILLVDEALAVGDQSFKRRSFARIDEIRESAGTVFLVTHNTGEIRRTCTRTIWIEQGRLVMDGAADEVCDAYTEGYRDVRAMEEADGPAE
jgi:teichoic acid transport system ATP-binding protein